MEAEKLETQKERDDIRSHPPRQLRTTEAARYIGVSERTLRSLVAERKIPFVRIRRRIIFRLVDLDTWIEEHVEGVAL